ncbi:MAG: fimbrillin family protein [Bacteroidaceae bacterium]|nr:fimbrillin family protein [Bacteroidaceae bacterium]
MKKYIPFILAAIAVACEPTELDKGDAVLITGDAVEITSSSACLCGEIVSSQSGTVWFELSENSEMSDSRKTSSKTLESVNHLSEVSLRTEKLSPNTTYYYRLCGKLDYDGYSMLAEKGAIRSFTTDKYPPVKAEVYVNTPSTADFVDYFVVENGDVMERSARHSFDGYDSSRKMRYIKTTTAISDADIYMCQFTNEDLSDYRSVSFNLNNGPFYYGHTTVSSMEPEAVCEMKPATCEVRFNIACKSQNGYVDDGNIYQMSLVNADGGKTLPICSSATCDLSTGHVTGVTDAKATVSAYTDIWLNSNDTQKASFPAVIPATAGEGEAELWFYVKSLNVDSLIKKAMPAFEWSAGNTYTYNITLYYTPQTVELVIGSCTIEPWGEEQYVDDLSMGELNTNGHEYVDLGLSVKWATCNVGASIPSDYGSYFAWGETSPKSSYDWENLKYCNDTSGRSFSKYNQNQDGTQDTRTTLELGDDAARVNWGGSWRMPTDAEFLELIDNCTWTWTSMNRKNGYKVVSKVNGNSIFLPAAGLCDGTSIHDARRSGFYWSSSLNGSNSYNALNLCFNPGDHFPGGYGRRSGQSVRPVLR